MCVPYRRVEDATSELTDIEKKIIIKELRTLVENFEEYNRRGSHFKFDFNEWIVYRKGIIAKLEKSLEKKGDG